MNIRKVIQSSSWFPNVIAATSQTLRFGSEAFSQGDSDVVDRRGGGWGLQICIVDTHSWWLWPLARSGDQRVSLFSQVCKLAFHRLGGRVAFCWGFFLVPFFC